MNTKERRWVCRGCEVCVTAEYIDGNPEDTGTECSNCGEVGGFVEVFTRDQILEGHRREDRELFNKSDENNLATATRWTDNLLGHMTC